MNATFLSPAEGDELAEAVIAELAPAQRRALVAALDAEADTPEGGDALSDINGNTLRGLATRRLVTLDGVRGLTLTGRRVAEHLDANRGTQPPLADLRIPSFVAPPALDEDEDVA